LPPNFGDNKNAALMQFGVKNSNLTKMVAYVVYDMDSTIPVQNKKYN